MHKELLQTLAVIGREFPLVADSAVASKPDDELDRMLANCRLGEFIYEQPATGDVEYIFKHALTQEVAYNSVLIERRKQLHERAGQALESMFADQLDDHLNELAHHYSRSDNARQGGRVSAAAPASRRCNAPCMATRSLISLLLSICWESFRKALSSFSESCSCNYYLTER